MACLIRWPGKSELLGNNISTSETITNPEAQASSHASGAYEDLAAANPSGVVGQTGTRNIAIYLTAANLHSDCVFWVGLSRLGNLSPRELLHEKDVGAVLQLASITGIQDQCPVMLADTLSSPPHYTYLVAPPTAEPYGVSTWVTDLVKTIYLWQPVKLGFYFCPQILGAMNPVDSIELLSQVLRDLCGAGYAREFYLFLGSHSLNSLLNGMLNLKIRLEEEGINVAIFH